MRRDIWLGYLAGTAFLMSSGASASPVPGLVIADTPTRNVTCSAGVCTSSADSAVLNVADLQALLAQSDVTIMVAHRSADITFEAPFTWAAPTKLTLDAYHSVRGNKPMTVPAGAALTVLTNHGGTGGTLSFGPHGRFDFTSTASVLTINGIVFTLESTIAGLAAAVIDNYDENYALANDYDASVDGVYSLPPIPTRFYGMFEGLGHVVRGVTVDALTYTGPTGFFSHAGALVENLGLPGIRIRSMKGPLVGGVAGQMDGIVRGVWTSGKISGKARMVEVGGLVGYGVTSMENCFSTATVQTSAQMSLAGGLVGSLFGAVSSSYATGPVTAGDLSYAGGLTGVIFGGGPAYVTNSYATGAVTAGASSVAGGLLGADDQSSAPLATAASTYSNGLVTTIGQIGAGGFVGQEAPGQLPCSACYWDLTTSGTTSGAGEGSLTPLVSPLTTQQLQSSLPSGFSDQVWGQSPAINGGFPYLLALPPR